MAGFDFPEQLSCLEAKKKVAIVLSYPPYLIFVFSSSHVPSKTYICSVAIDLRDRCALKQDMLELPLKNASQLTY